MLASSPPPPLRLLAAPAALMDSGILLASVMAVALNAFFNGARADARAH